MEQARCVLCDETSSRVIHAHDERDGETVRAVICGRCGFAYLDPRRTQAEYDAFYRTGYHQELHSIPDKEVAVRKLREKKSAQRFKDIVPFLSEGLGPGKRVLDIGAGFGNLLSMIRDATGASALGIEHSRLASEVAKDVYGLEIRPVGFEEFVRSAPGTFDLITMHHVFEHLLEPRRVLEEIRTLLTPTGRVYIAVPNVMEILEPPDEFFRIPHPWYFSPWTIGRLLDRAGFTIVAFRRQSPPKVGMELLAVPKERGEKAVDPSMLAVGKDPEAVVRYVRAAERRYAFYRGAKRVLGALLPETQRNRIGLMARKAVRKLKL